MENSTTQELVLKNLELCTSIHVTGIFAMVGNDVMEQEQSTIKDQCTDADWDRYKSLKKPEESMVKGKTYVTTVIEEAANVGSVEVFPITMGDFVCPGEWPHLYVNLATHINMVVVPNNIKKSDVAEVEDGCQ